jgi:hypothetical protein
LWPISEVATPFIEVRCGIRRLRFTARNSPSEEDNAALHLKSLTAVARVTE